MSGRAVAANGKMGTLVRALDGISETVRLEDGTVLAVHLTFKEVVRVDDEWDKQGKPVYSVRPHMAIVVDHAPEELTRLKR